MIGNPGASLERLLTDGVADGRLTVGDADTVREFADFLQHVGPVRPLPVSVLREYRDLLGITDDQIDECERRRREVTP